jgi:hypothetical protein
MARGERAKLLLELGDIAMRTAARLKAQVAHEFRKRLGRLDGWRIVPLRQGGESRP